MEADPWTMGLERIKWIHLVWVALTYLILVFMMVRLVRKRRQPWRPDADDSDGGLPVIPEPDLDLPPGVVLPGNGPTLKKEEPEEMLA